MFLDIRENNLDISLSNKVVFKEIRIPTDMLNSFEEIWKLIVNFFVGHENKYKKNERKIQEYSSYSRFIAY